jgi:integrase
MERMKNFPGLVRRGSVYYVRVRVPRDLIGVLKCAELKQTLGTRDVKEARRAYQRVYGELLRQITQIRERLNPTGSAIADEVLRETVRQWFFSHWEQCNRAFDAPAAPGAPSAEEMVAQAEMELDSLAEAVAPSVAFAKRLLNQRGHASPTADDLQKMAGYVRRGTALLNRAIIEHYRDHRFHHIIDDPLFQGVTGIAELAAEATSQSVLCLADVIARFKNDPQRKKLSPKNALGYQMAFRVLEEVAGPQAAISAVSREHARQVRFLLSKLPPNATKRFRGVRLQRVAQLAEAQALKPMEAGTAENILRNLSAFFAWAMREHYVARNPFDGMRPLQEQKSAEEERQPFDEAALAAVFSSPIFTERNDEAAHPARFWIPLLALYHGARLNELCQLEVNDIGLETGIPVIWIRKASGNGRVKRLKTINAERTIPIHPKVLALGFLEFVERQRDAGHLDLFPDVPPGSTGYRSDTFQKWFSRFRRSVGVGDRRMTFHGFRHNFSDAARAADISGEIVDEIAGWSAGKSMRRHYGAGYAVARKRDEIAKIVYPCVERVLKPDGVPRPSPGAGTIAAAAGLAG